MITVPVELGARRYDVVVGDGVRHELGALVAERLPGPVRRAALVTQAAVVDAGWLDGLDPGVPFDVTVVPDGEAAKSLATVEDLCRRFARAGLARSDVVVAVGGGVVSDVAGLAAALYHRGTPLVTVATTLLAQIDAAIGGKTGVNLPEGKNLIGAFWQPAGVLCDTGTLSSLPPREWACGRGEMAKYAFLDGGDPDASLLELSIDEQVARCARIKAEVVAADEREDGRRAILNYGHTLAHALEARALDDRALDDRALDDRALDDRALDDRALDDRALEGAVHDAPRHGEAVAVGLVFAALLARRLGRIDDQRVALHRQVVAGFDLSAELPPRASGADLLRSMARDKKARHDLTFVLDGPHGVETVRNVAPEAVLATLAEMGAT